MREFTRGDKVRVRKDLKVGSCGGNSVVGAMLDYRGKEGVITFAGMGVNGAYVNFDDNGVPPYKWTNEMLEDVTNTTNLVYVSIDKNPSKPYLFSVKNGIELKEGEKVIVSTVKGEPLATVIGNSFTVDAPTLKIIKSTIPCGNPLRPVLGIAELKYTLRNGGF